MFEQRPEGSEGISMGQLRWCPVVSAEILSKNMLGLKEEHEGGRCGWNSIGEEDRDGGGGGGGRSERRGDQTG